MATRVSCWRCGKTAARSADRFCTACGLLLDRTPARRRRLAAGAVVGVAALVLTLVLMRAALGGH
jgi:ribosomal protein L37E